MPNKQQRDYARLFMILFTVLLIALLSFVLLKAFSQPVAILQEQGEKAVESIFSEELKQDSESSRVNMLFLGISGEGYIAGELTDSIIVASLTETNEQNVLVSIPRDLWVQTSASFDKINSLYKDGGGTTTPDYTKTELVKQKVQNITGLNIHYTAVVNLQAIQKVIDLVGDIHIDGQPYNAEQVEQYIRERNKTHTDFDRIHRQQRVLLALLEKLKQYNYTESLENVLALVGVLTTDISTDISFSEYLNFFQLLSSIDSEAAQLYSLSPATGLVKQEYQTRDGLRVWALVPTQGIEQYESIQTFIHDAINEV